MSLIAEGTMIAQHFWMFTERSAINRIRRKKNFKANSLCAFKNFLLFSTFQFLKKLSCKTILFEMDFRC